MISSQVSAIMKCVTLAVHSCTKFACKSSSRILGLLNIRSSEWFTNTNLIDENKINKMVLDRNKARSEKNFELADEIRDSLKEMGIYIEDSEQGTKWRIE